MIQSIDDLRAQATELAKTNSDAAWLLSQGAIPFNVQPGSQITAPGGGPLYPGYTYYNSGDLGAFVPTQGPGSVVPSNPAFIAAPKHDNGFAQNTQDFFNPRKNGGMGVIYTALSAGLLGGAGAATEATAVTPEAVAGVAGQGPTGAATAGAAGTAAATTQAQEASVASASSAPPETLGSGSPSMPAATPEPAGGPTAPGGSAQQPPTAPAEPAGTNQSNNQNQPTGKTVLDSLKTASQILGPASSLFLVASGKKSGQQQSSQPPPPPLPPPTLPVFGADHGPLSAPVVERSIVQDQVQRRGRSSTILTSQDDRLGS